MTAPQVSSGRQLRAGGGSLRALVVEDEQQLAEVITDMLRLEGWDVATALTGAAALRLAPQLAPDVVVLDVNLPDTDGFAVLSELRRAQPDLCVLFLTGRDAVPDRVAGLRAGADDYVTKPFSFTEVFARLQGLVRRAGLAAPMTPKLLAVDDLVLDPNTREVRRGGQAIALTATEFGVLHKLMQRPGRVVTKAEILEAVWGSQVAVQGHVVELYISYLRKKIENGRPPLLRTIRGVGYLIRPPGR